MPGNYDALPPPEMAEQAEAVGVRKAGLDAPRTLLLAVSAGAFIALGANAATVALTGTTGIVPWGWSRLVAGLAFSVGLGLVVVGGAELFTGNNLVVMAWASGKVPTRRLLRNWVLVYLGNLSGALGTAGLVFVGGQHRFAGAALGRTMLDLAAAKVQLGVVSMFALAVLCNTLVCLAVWLTMSARTTVDRIVATTLPVAVFVAAGFEHCVANMYFLPLALLVRHGATPDFWSAIQRQPEDYAALDVVSVLVNLAVVTAGNLVGGAGLVGLVYWIIYLRRTP